ncbi:MAG: tRNA pseudouridine55 synthase, partial [Thermoproteota archaeon]
SLRCKVSTGTYVRTLFTDSAHHLGTLGVLEYLIRESIGGIHMNESIKKENWPQDLKWDLDHFKTDVDVMLPFEQISFSEFQFKLISNGQKLNLEKHQIVFPKSDFSNKYFWGYYGEDLIGLVKISGDELVMDVNFFQ